MTQKYKFRIIEIFTPKNIESWLILDPKILDDHPRTFSLEVPPLRTTETP